MYRGLLTVSILLFGLGSFTSSEFLFILLVLLQFTLGFYTYRLYGIAHHLTHTEHIGSIDDLMIGYFEDCTF